MKNRDSKLPPEKRRKYKEIKSEFDEIRNRDCNPELSPEKRRKYEQICLLFDEVMRKHGVREHDIFVRAYGDVTLGREKLGPFLYDITVCEEQVIEYCQKALNSDSLDGIEI